MDDVRTGCPGTVDHPGAQTLCWRPSTDGLLQSLDLAPLILDGARVFPCRTHLRASPLPGHWTTRMGGPQFVFAEQQRDLNFTTSDFMPMIRVGLETGSFSRRIVRSVVRPEQRSGGRNDLWNNPEHREQKDRCFMRCSSGTLRARSKPHTGLRHGAKPDRRD
ncbi:MAG: hypothetical protein Ct9H300mP7_5600 [Verrucomicrobiota bacterium]|nr:MAG: hypothetical protein Ct9H300mP7_5600 [Verrucomicrobiota bacterium]